MSNVYEVFCAKAKVSPKDLICFLFTSAPTVLGPIGVVPLALLSRRISSPAVLIAKISLFPLQKQNKQQLMIIREEKDALVCFNYNKRHPLPAHS